MLQNTTEPGAGKPIIELQGLCKTFRTKAGEVRALENIDLAIQPGEPKRRGGRLRGVARARPALYDGTKGPKALQKPEQYRVEKRK